MNQPPTKNFIPGLAALRGGAMLLGVLLHALIPYLSKPVPGLLWPVREPAPMSTGIDAVYWLIHGFRVPLFFVLAGMFAHWACAKHGPREFLRRRLRRLGVPLLLGTMTIIPLMYLVWSWGWVKSGLAEPSHIGHVRFGHNMQRDLYGFAHLWFLEYLLIYCGILALWRAISQRGKRDGDAAGSISSEPSTLPNRWFASLPALAVVVVAVPTAGVLWWDPRCLTEFHHWFLPRWSEFLYHGWFFIVGVLIGARPYALHLASRVWWAWLGAAPFAFWIMLRAVQAAPHEQNLALAASAAAYAWCMSLGLLGLVVRCVPRVGTVARYLSDRAYWLYVSHPPFVGLVQVLLHRVDVPVWAKVALAFVGAVGAGLALHAAMAVGRRARVRWQF